VTVLGVFGVNWLDLLLRRLLSGVGVRREILSLLSTLSVSNSTRLLAAKLFLIVGLVDWKASNRACW
jgi:hypothetical protein